MKLGDVCQEEKKFDEARKYFEDSFVIKKALYEEERTKERYVDCVITCKRLINICRFDGNIALMLKWFEVFQSLGKAE